MKHFWDWADLSVEWQDNPGWNRVPGATFRLKGNERSSSWLTRSSGGAVPSPRSPLAPRGFGMVSLGGGVCFQSIATWVCANPAAMAYSACLTGIKRGPFHVEPKVIPARHGRKRRQDGVERGRPAHPGSLEQEVAREPSAIRKFLNLGPGFLE